METKRRKKMATSEQIAEAREYLISKLTGVERVPFEVMQESRASGISGEALYRARVELGIRRWKSKWYMTAEESERAKEFKSIKGGEKAISSDWISVFIEETEKSKGVEVYDEFQTASSNT